MASAMVLGLMGVLVLASSPISATLHTTSASPASSPIQSVASYHLQSAPIHDANFVPTSVSSSKTATNSSTNSFSQDTIYTATSADGKPASALTCGSYSIDDENALGATSLTLTPSGDAYFFAAGIGGNGLSGTSWVGDLNVTSNTNGGDIDASIGHQSSSTGSYTTSSNNYAIGGVAIGGGLTIFHEFSASVSPSSPVGEESVPLTFQVNATSCVLIAVGASGYGSLSMSGVSLTTLEDFTVSELGNEVNGSVAFYAGNLTKGEYTADIVGYADTGTNHNGLVIGAVAYVLGPTLSSVTLSPRTASVASGTTQQFTAIPTCTATCPAGTTYSWTLTNSAMGNLSAVTGSTVTFTGGSILGTVGLFVNATLNGLTKQSSASIITVTAAILNAVAVSPTSVSLATGAAQHFTATPTCTATCPAGTTYSWTLTNSAIGNLSAVTGPTVTFKAGLTLGTVGLIANATLNGVTKQSNTAIITVNGLTSVAISPTRASVGTEATTPSITATPTCSSTCPSGTTYSWTLTNNTMGTLNATSGDVVAFIAGNTSGTVGLFVNATLNGRTVQGGPVTITIVPGPLVANVTLSAYYVQNGTPVTATAHLRNATAPTYTWTLNGSEPLSCTTSTCTFTLNHAATYEVNLTVTDGNRTAWSQCPLKVHYSSAPPLPLVGNVTLSANGTHPWTQVWVNATASGGQGSYGYVWTLNGTKSMGTAASLSFTPHGAANYRFTVNITDSVGQWIDKRTELTVLPNGTYLPLSVSLGANATQVLAGATVELTGSASGGMVPYTYVWSLNGTNDSLLGASSVLSIQLSNPGNYTYQLWVTDSARHISASLPITIEVLSQTQTSSQSAPSSSATPWWLILGIVILVVALLLLLLYWARRRGQREPKEDAPPSVRWVAQPIPPKPPADYMEGISVAPADWDESAEPANAYGTYIVHPQEHSDFSGIGRGGVGAASGYARVESHSSPELDAYRPFSMKITPDGIEVEEIPSPTPGPRVVNAEFSPVSEWKPTTQRPKLPGPSSADVYAVMQSLTRKPRSLDGIKQEVRLDDNTLFTVLGGLSEAKLITRGTKTGTQATVFVLTPLGRKVAHRFIQPQEVESRREVGASERAALPAGKAPSRNRAPRLDKDTTLQDVHTIGKERGSLAEETPFKSLRPEDINPQLKGQKPLPKAVLQPMEMRVQSDRGTDTLDSTEITDSEKRTQILMERAKKERKEMDKFGVEQTARPREEGQER